MEETVKIQFTIGKQTREVIYDTGESILDSALRNDLNPPYSCLEGVCSSCLAQVEEGQVDFPDDTVLDESDVAKGRILSCRAKPAQGCTFLKINYDAV
jgi:ring-1,2-phenylacetyl-CoA epoxidase subunit PaaE